VIRILNHVLVEELHLSATTRSFLPHLTGPNVHSLHRLFSDQERHARSAGALVLAGAEEIAVATNAAATGAGLPARNMIGELLSMHEGVATRLRDDLAAASNRLGDPGYERFCRAAGRVSRDDRVDAAHAVGRFRRTPLIFFPSGALRRARHRSMEGTVARIRGNSPRREKRGRR